MKKDEKYFVIGCGYVGSKVAHHLANKPLIALARSQHSQSRLQTLGIPWVYGDLDERDSLVKLPVKNTILYYFVPPPATGLVDSRLTNLCTSFEHLPQKIILISTTGVYGDCQGAWIDETQPLNPQTDRAKRRVHAETVLQQWAETQGVAITIFRVPGIYGPDRLPLKRLQQETPVLDPAISPFSNRIHIDDLVNACLVARDREKTGIYNISDGHPTTMTDFFNQVAQAFHFPLPPTVDWSQAKQQFSASMMSYLAESKRLDNRKMREQLGVIPRYSDLQTGLAQCVQSFHETSLLG